MIALAIAFHVTPSGLCVSPPAHLMGGTSRCSPQVMSISPRMVETSFEKLKLSRGKTGPLSQVELAQLSGQVRKLANWEGVRADLSNKLGRSCTAEEMALELELQGGAAEYLERRVAMQAAKSSLISSNMGLVVSVARRYVNQGVPLQDLVQEGIIGLMLAAERFDPSKGFKFSTYVSYWIRQCIRKAIIRSRPIRLPDQMHFAVKRLRAADNELERRLGRRPTLEERASHLELPVERLRAIENADVVSRTLSIDEPLRIGSVGESKGLERLDTLTDDREGELRGKAEHRQALAQALNQLLDSSLTEREAQVMRARYSLGRDEDVLNSVQVAKELGISPSRVRELESSALKKLRMRARGLEREFVMSP